MSANNPSANARGIGGVHGGVHGGGGGVSSYPQLSKDGTQISYPWLPHSTALGASSTVAFRVRNASLSGVGPGVA
eukprot:CAMPEP_0172564870 /NCGR_PEP_ID=MMETSP1067-20121228/106003_1 /TAXON_ID=265564 ORGANISM="Thalassiosira punctigera, Strain Tpunct2005C2" /NCGR_SAMPLE_ID=MMETSP1067 /ASSEMBLY_ACC=CAM_ASM_000444 /LENGTH=74 /DNA_ID=CAMNT_0013355645 /DNA_START=11 /DNA_END=231 /DNA_ORIENTATION=-